MNSRRLIVTGMGSFHARASKQIERYHAVNVPSCHRGQRMPSQPQPFIEKFFLSKPVALRPLPWGKITASE
jgi:hypothetical protein